MARNFARPINFPEPSGSYGRSFSSGSPIADALIAKDLEQYAQDEGDDSSQSDHDEDDSDATLRGPSNNLSLTGSYRRPSYFTTVSKSTVVPRQVDHGRLFGQEREDAIEQERDLLADNNIIPPDSAGKAREGSLKHKISGMFSRRGSTSKPEPLPNESTSLLAPSERAEGTVSNVQDAEEIDKKWEEAVKAGLIQTTWQREAQVVGKYAMPLMFAFILQYSLTVASIFTLGHLGKEELGAVSLASMTANITGYAVYQGLATSLDTLCAQAYGSGKKKLVGLQMQRMVYFLWTITIPIALAWVFADKILVRIVPETEVAVLAGRYLKIVALGAPGYALFESGKRYVQAQGLFWASLYVLLFCAPLNAFMNWLFVWVSLFSRLMNRTIFPIFMLTKTEI